MRRKSTSSTSSRGWWRWASRSIARRARVEFDIRDLEVLPGVKEVHRISAPYKLAGRSFRPEGTVVRLRNGLKVGGQDVVVMAGPCSVESRDQLFAAARQVR